MTTTAPPTTLEVAAGRLARLLSGEAAGLSDPTNSNLDFEAELRLRPLGEPLAVAEAWAVDGGQGTVVDARCIQVLITRAARVRFAGGRCTLEDEGVVRAHLVGPAERAAALASLGLPGLAPDAAVDINLLRDRWEWEAVERAVAEAGPGSMVLVDGDLQPDWRIPSSYLAGLFATAAARGVILAAVVKHSSLAVGGAPLLGALEREAEALFGARARWWCPVARTRPDVDPGIQVVAARLDPDARFAFRIDLPADVDAEAALRSLASISDDAAFPGYPYPLSVADRLAACPGWLRDEVRFELDDLLDRAGVAPDVRDRAFADRHRMMERS